MVIELMPLSSQAAAEQAKSGDAMALAEAEAKEGAFVKVCFVFIVLVVSELGFFTTTAAVVCFGLNPMLGFFRREGKLSTPTRSPWMKKRTKKKKRKRSSKRNVRMEPFLAF